MREEVLVVPRSGAASQTRARRALSKAERAAARRQKTNATVSTTPMRPMETGSGAQELSRGEDAESGWVGTDGEGEGEGEREGVRRNFLCLFSQCDVSCDSRERLIEHLQTAHGSMDVTDGPRVGPSTMRGGRRRGGQGPAGTVLKEEVMGDEGEVGVGKRTG